MASEVSQICNTYLRKIISNFELPTWAQLLCSCRSGSNDVVSMSAFATYLMYLESLLLHRSIFTRVLHFWIDSSNYLSLSLNHLR